MLKYRLKCLLRTDEFSDKARRLRLIHEIRDLLRYADHHMHRKLAVLGILAILTLPMSAQELFFRDPVEYNFQSNFYPPDFVIEDTSGTYPFTTDLYSSQGYHIEFVDFDNDGDDDAFYAIGDDCGYWCNDQYMAAILYQENISGDTVAFRDPEILYMNREILFVFTLQVSDLDGDGDLDFMLQIPWNNALVLENISEEPGNFDLIETDTLQFESLDYFGLFRSDLMDIDRDGDLDIVTAVLDTSYTGIQLAYLPNNGNVFHADFEDSLYLHGPPLDLAVEEIASNNWLTHFEDMDHDGDDDLLFQVVMQDDDQTDPYNYYLENRLYFYENTNGATNEFISRPTYLTETEIFQDNYSYYEYSYLNFCDFDNDGDKDVVDLQMLSYLDCGYCGYITRLNTIQFIENVSPLPTGIYGHQPIQFQLYPNPATDRALLEFDNAGHSKAVLEVYDLNGSLLLIDETYDETFELHRRALPAGFYTFRLSVNGLDGAGKLVFIE